jgi:peptidyl-Lys metalloendopeptidase
MRKTAVVHVRVPLSVSVALASVWFAGAAAAAPLAAEPQPTFSGCSSSQQQQVATAADAAQHFATQAYGYLRSHTSATPRYTTWFGTYTAARHSTATSHFAAISQAKFAALSYDCTCQDSGVGHVDPDQADRVVVCEGFWAAPVTGTDSKAGALINLVGRFPKDGGLHDSVQGQAGCKTLARDHPDVAAMNAASDQYFAENNPPLP